MRTTWIAAFAAVAPLAHAGFSEAETKAVQAYWAAPGRYSSTPSGEWAARLTPEGSVWLRELFRLMTPGKVNPTRDPVTEDPTLAAWKAWTDAKIAFDQDRATVAAAAKNGQIVAPSVADPGLSPTALVARLGQVPPFAEAVLPSRHVVTFHDGTSLEYVDNLKMRPSFAYYRFRHGVKSGGVRVREMPASELQGLFKSAGLDARAQRVFAAVSLLEGGFDSVNTYDTGYVSVGMIQFACLQGGAGSLGEVLQEWKGASPAAYQRNFRSFGLDVDTEGRLVALDLAHGQERTGTDAALQIIADKRLTAVFQRAGRVCRDFRVAQLRTAYERFYPADEQVTVNLDGRAHTVRVGEIFRSEAGMATVMDRKVNTGKLEGLGVAIEEAAADFGIVDPAELPVLEYALVRSYTYRKDYLVAEDLSKPRMVTATAFRQGTRQGSRKGRGG